MEVFSTNLPNREILHQRTQGPNNFFLIFAANLNEEGRRDSWRARNPSNLNLESPHGNFQVENSRRDIESILAQIFSTHCFLD